MREELGGSGLHFEQDVASGSEHESEGNRAVSVLICSIAFRPFVSSSASQPSFLVHLLNLLLTEQLTCLT
jgi:hypothetical protein